MAKYPDYSQSTSCTQFLLLSFLPKTFCRQKDNNVLCCFLSYRPRECRTVFNEHWTRPYRFGFDEQQTKVPVFMIAIVVYFQRNSMTGSRDNQKEVPWSEKTVHNINKSSTSTIIFSICQRATGRERIYTHSCPLITNKTFQSNKRNVSSATEAARAEQPYVYFYVTLCYFEYTLIEPTVKTDESYRVPQIL